jgi:acyl dehydratase
MAERLYLEDLSVGQIFESGSIEVTRDSIRAFAEQFDPQPFHLDEEAARQSLFGGLAASGWHTASITMRLLTESLPLAGGIIGASMDEIAWPRPTRPGDCLRVRVEVLELRPSKSKPERGMAKTQTVTLNQADETVQQMKSNIIVWRK